MINDNFQLNQIADAQEQKSNSEQHSALRSSLFSNMPPYIRFASHDVKGNFIYFF